MAAVHLVGHVERHVVSNTWCKSIPSCSKSCWIRTLQTNIECGSCTATNQWNVSFQSIIIDIDEEKSCLTLDYSSMSTCGARQFPDWQTTNHHYHCLKKRVTDDQSLQVRLHHLRHCLSRPLDGDDGEGSPREAWWLQDETMHHCVVAASRSAAAVAVSHEECLLWLHILVLSLSFCDFYWLYLLARGPFLNRGL